MDAGNRAIRKPVPRGLRATRRRREIARLPGKREGPSKRESIWISHWRREGEMPKEEWALGKK